MNHKTLSSSGSVRSRGEDRGGASTRWKMTVRHGIARFERGTELEGCAMGQRNGDSSGCGLGIELGVSGSACAEAAGGVPEEVLAVALRKGQAARRLAVMSSAAEPTPSNGSIFGMPVCQEAASAAGAVTATPAKPRPPDAKETEHSQAGSPPVLILAATTQQLPLAKCSMRCNEGTDIVLVSSCGLIELTFDTAWEPPLRGLGKARANDMAHGSPERCITSSGAAWLRDIQLWHHVCVESRKQSAAALSSGWCKEICETALLPQWNFVLQTFAVSKKSTELWLFIGSGANHWAKRHVKVSSFFAQQYDGKPLDRVTTMVTKDMVADCQAKAMVTRI